MMRMKAVLLDWWSEPSLQFFTIFHKSILQRGTELLRSFRIPVCLALVCPTLGGPPQLHVALYLVLPHFCGHQTPNHDKTQCLFLHLYTFTEINHLLVYGIKLIAKTSGVIVKSWMWTCKTNFSMTWPGRRQLSRRSHSVNATEVASPGKTETNNQYKE